MKHSATRYAPMPPPHSAESEAALRRVGAVAHALDELFVIPGTNIRIGLDALIGLIPGFGDFIGALLSSYILLEAMNARVPPLVLARMMANVGVEAAVGAVPVVGDAFDVVWKANRKNHELLRAHLLQPVQTRRVSRAVTIAVSIVVVIFVVLLCSLMIVGLVALVQWLMRT